MSSLDDTIDLDRIMREMFESMPQKRLVEIAIEKTLEIRKLREENQALKQLL